MFSNSGAGEDTLRVSWIARRSNQSILKEINPVGRTDAEAEALILWPPNAKSWLTGKDPDAGKDWRQNKGEAEDEMVGWHYWLNGHEFEQSRGEQGSFTCCSPWDHKESDTTYWLNNKMLWGASQVIPGSGKSGRSPAEGNGNPLQYSWLGSPVDRGDWRATVHGGHKESDMT